MKNAHKNTIDPINNDNYHQLRVRGESIPSHHAYQTIVPKTRSRKGSERIVLRKSIQLDSVNTRSIGYSPNKSERCLEYSRSQIRQIKRKTRLLRLRWLSDRHGLRDILAQQVVPGPLS